jgi:hypothetical protein
MGIMPIDLTLHPYIKTFDSAVDVIKKIIEVFYIILNSKLQIRSREIGCFSKFFFYSK